MKVIVTCPDRHGVFPGFYSAAGYFPVGDTEADLSEDDVKAIEGEISRKESILSVKRIAEKEQPKGKPQK